MVHELDNIDPHAFMCYQEADLQRSLAMGWREEARLLLRKAENAEKTAEFWESRAKDAIN